MHPRTSLPLVLACSLGGAVLHLFSQCPILCWDMTKTYYFHDNLGWPPRQGVLTHAKIVQSYCSLFLSMAGLCGGVATMVSSWKSNDISSSLASLVSVDDRSVSRVTSPILTHFTRRLPRNTFLLGICIWFLCSLATLRRLIYLMALLNRISDPFFSHFVSTCAAGGLKASDDDDAESLSSLSTTSGRNTIAASSIALVSIVMPYVRECVVRNKVRYTKKHGYKLFTTEGDDVVNDAGANANANANADANADANANANANANAHVDVNLLASSLPLHTLEGQRAFFRSHADILPVSKIDHWCSHGTLDEQKRRCSFHLKIAALLVVMERRKEDIEWILLLSKSNSFSNHTIIV